MTRDHVLMIDCRGERLPAIVSDADGTGCDTGVVIVVGGPQYRAGSHRQFVHAARSLAAAGITALRFDVRGMGDAAGTAAGFENIDADVCAAIDALLAARPRLRRVVLYGLCDGASAALLYWQRTRDTRVAGLCLLNPWLRSEQTLARTHVRHYYLARLKQRDFWAKVLSGRVAARAARELIATLRSASAKSQVAVDFRQAMAAGMTSFTGPVLLLMSGADLTAREFDDGARADPAWAGALVRAGVQRVDFETADHTFSRMADRVAMERTVADWLLGTFAATARHPEDCHV